jgi:hypothetical protein
MVKSVKNVQRSDPEAWYRYTAEHGENIRDPSRHAMQFLEDFLRQYSGGTPTVPVVARGKFEAPSGKMSAPPGRLAGLQAN